MCVPMCVLEGVLAFQEELVEHNSEDSLASMHLAMLYKWFERRQQHAEIRRMLLERADVTDEEEVAARATMAIVVDPNPDSELLGRATELAHRAVALGKQNNSDLLPWSRLATAMAACRQGNYADSERFCTEVWMMSNHDRQRDAALFFRAMARFHLGKTEHAQLDFTRAKVMMPPCANHNDAGSATNQSEDYVTWMAYDEARTLLERQ